jgi:signal peptidase II
LRSTSSEPPEDQSLLSGNTQPEHADPVVATARPVRLYDVFALLTAICVVGLDQWVKSLVVAHLSPPDFGPQVPIVGQYLVLYYIRNQGAAFSMFNTNGPILFVLIAAAIAVIFYLYARTFNSGSLLYKLVFGLIIGGAAGNLLDRFIHGSVVDFIWFRIPQMHFSFAIFNLADAAITVGVILLFVALLLTSSRARATEKHEAPPAGGSARDGAPSPQEQDVQH